MVQNMNCSFWCICSFVINRQFWWQNREFRLGHGKVKISKNCPRIRICHSSALGQLANNYRPISLLPLPCKSFEKIVNPTTYELFDYAEFLKNNEKFKEAIKYYSEVLNLVETKDSLFAQAIEGRGVAYERTDQWKKAEIDLLKSLKLSPDDAYVINYLAYSWIEKGIKIKKSLEMLRKANRLQPNDGYIIDSLGWASL